MVTARLGLTKNTSTTTLGDRVTNDDANLELIDDNAAMYLQDVIASRPGAGKEGRYFWSTDESLLYYDDGAAWNVVSSSSLPAATPQGAIIYVNATPEYALLSPGTAYYPLVSGGAASNPSFASISAILDALVSNTQYDIAVRGAASWEGKTVIESLQDQVPSLAGGLYRNPVINGSFLINQRACGAAAYTSATNPANSDDTYLLDRWILLSDGDDIVDVSQETSVVPTTSPTSLKLEVETANKKFGICQIIEMRDAVRFAGKYASLQFKARTTTGKVIENIRAAVLAWDGTADTVTSDVVSAWNAEGANPTFVANWTAENTPEDLTLVADTWTTFKIENIYIDTSGMKNLAVFIWVDDGDAAVDDVLYLADVQLNEGAVSLPFAPGSYTDELQKCMRFLQVRGGDNVYSRWATGICASSVLAYLVVFHVPAMRTTPVLSGSWSALNKVAIVGSGYSIVEPTGISAEGATNASSTVIQVDTASGLTANVATELLSYTELNQVRFTAEL